ncbi:MAG: hypothetical protein ABR538_06415, partial [Candidatus Binatia bacterium]
MSKNFFSTRPAGTGAGQPMDASPANRTRRPASLFTGLWGAPLMLAASLVPAAVLLAAATTTRAADLAPEKVGNVFELPAKPGPHWFWASDILLHRTALFDAADGRLLGTISSGAAGSGFVINPMFPPAHDEIYIPETYWSRGIRGDRTDVVTMY